MPKVIYRAHDGSEHSLEVRAGLSVMEGAINNSVPGIEAECGGCCSCATCHVYVDPDWSEATGKADPLERDMLESVMDLRETSRLSCQITVTEDMDGLVVKLPELQI